MSTTNDATLRDEVRPADVEAIRELVAGTGYFDAGEVAIAAELAQERLARGADSGYEFLFAERDGRLLGYSCYGLIPCSSVSWDLYWIAVAADAQGGGLGRRILRLTEERVAAAGGLAVYAETAGREQYQPTRAFYRRCGYTVAAVFEDFYAPGDAKYTFVKRLTA
jgi:ribosomal protein S18 acetylase RimI-like enzyme